MGHSPPAASKPPFFIVGKPPSWAKDWGSRIKMVGEQDPLAINLVYQALFRISAIFNERCVAINQDPYFTLL